METHSKHMLTALALARKAAQKDEVPVGAVIVWRGAVIAKAYNLRETKKNPLVHAEILAIAEAARKLKRWRLSGCTLYVTLEPCPMCAGAIVNARIDTVIFGAYDPKGGAFGSLYNLAEGRLNHSPSVTGGIMAEESSNLLKQYFKGKRADGRNASN